MSSSSNSDSALPYDPRRMPQTDPWWALAYQDEWTLVSLMDWAGRRYAERDAVWSEEQGWLTHGKIHTLVAKV